MFAQDVDFSIQRFGARPRHVRALYGEGRTILLPGGEADPWRCPGSAITGYLNPCPACRAPSQLPPLLTLMGTGDASRTTQRGSQGVLCMPLPGNRLSCSPGPGIGQHNMRWPRLGPCSLLRRRHLSPLSWEQGWCPGTQAQHQSWPTAPVSHARQQRLN